MSEEYDRIEPREVPPGKRRLYGKRVRARSWFYFFFEFLPIMGPDNQYMRKPGELPADADPRYWWSVIVYDAYTYRLHLKAGVHHPNAEGYVFCYNWWGGLPEQQDTYLYANRKLSLWN